MAESIALPYRSNVYYFSLYLSSNFYLFSSSSFILFFINFFYFSDSASCLYLNFLDVLTSGSSSSSLGKSKEINGFSFFYFFSILDDLLNTELLLVYFSEFITLIDFFFNEFLVANKYLFELRIEYDMSTSTVSCY